jgi:Zn-dependent protease with chaperone function
MDDPAEDLGQYYDGDRPLAVPVRLALRQKQLYLTSADGLTRLAWDLRSIRPAGGIDPDGRAILRRKGRDARLVVDVGTLAPALRRALGLRQRSGGSWWVIGGAIGATVAALTFVFVLGGPRLLAPMVPLRWQAPLGDTVLQALEARHPVVDAPAEGQEALETLTAKLVAAAEIRHPVAITVLDDPTVNAFTLPGEQVVLLCGLIRRSDGDELAAVLGHELGHVQHHDPATMVLRQFGISALLAMLGVGDGMGLSNLAQHAAILSFSREMEAEADLSALQTLPRAGLRADGLARFFAKIETMGDSTPRWMASHPPTAERRALAESAPATGDHAFTDTEWKAVTAMCPAPATKNEKKQ